MAADDRLVPGCCHGCGRCCERDKSIGVWELLDFQGAMDLLRLEIRPCKQNMLDALIRYGLEMAASAIEEKFLAGNKHSTTMSGGTKFMD